MASGSPLPTARYRRRRDSGQATFFISSHTRQMVKRPAVGAEGCVLNHYDPAAIQAHLKAVANRMLKALAKTPPYADLQRQPGSLRLRLDRQFPGGIPEAARLRSDAVPARAGRRHRPEDRRHPPRLGPDAERTLRRQYLQPLTAWAKAHGTQFRSQTYGIPPVTLSSQRLVDLPEGEGTQWRRFSTTRWATSANHLYGRPVSSIETWTWLHSPVFRATPLDMKAEADLHFLQGVNQLVAHGWPYSPPSMPEPGWRFYAAAVFNQHNPWWIVMPDITTYLQRISWLLRQGTPANRRRGLYADARCVRGLQPGPRFGQSGDGRLDRAESGAGDSGRRVQLRFHDDGAIAAKGIP